MPDEHPQLQAALDLAHADPPISACGWNRPPGVCTCPAWDTVTRLANGGLLAERPCPPPDLPATLSTVDDQ